jgi:hypothetical protein
MSRPRVVLMLLCQDSLKLDIITRSVSMLVEVPVSSFEKRSVSFLEGDVVLEKGFGRLKVKGIIVTARV